MSFLEISRRLFIATLLCALVALFVPAQAKGMTAAKPGCCAQMKMTEQSDDSCPMHKQAPAKEQDSPCCQACALSLSLLFLTPRDFVYAQTGEASLVSLSVRSHSLAHRPPVPPPRFAIL